MSNYVILGASAAVADAVTSVNNFWEAFPEMLLMASSWGVAAAFAVCGLIVAAWVISKTTSLLFDR